MTQHWFTPSSFAAASRTARTLGALAAIALLPSCLAESSDAASEYREAVPEREAVIVAGPETDSATDSSEAGAPRNAQAAGPLGRAEVAEWYGFTRAVRGGVNAVTAWALGSVWLIVQLEPTTVEGDQAVWGPSTDSLEPVSYRFRVTKVGDAEYDYVLEGRPKASRSDGDYRAVLFGHGFSKRHERHGQGELTIDLDAARELDPFGREEDSGTVRIAHHLPRELDDGDALPRTIEADVRPDPSVNRESYTVKSVALADGTGTLRVVAKSDVDVSKSTALEDITVDSRWRRDGAGRADIAISGGDVAAGPGEVTAVECWGADFARSFYEDSVGFAPSEGDASACVYGAP